MSQYILYGGFKRVEPTFQGLVCLNDISAIDRIYEVEISYPRELYDLHSDLPFLSENKILPGSKIPKLIATFEKKTNYIIHSK